ncbi:hypothetical protein HDU85_005525 [Gaertneriomyces sp. JEL0708]|nr:hypothetical protein HDU85_005525 [Gaertneriomyces sp. JEL0708]
MDRVRERINELNRKGNVPRLNSRIGREAYLESAERIYDSGINYYRNKEYDKAYVMFLRFAILVGRELPTHPDSNGKVPPELIEHLDAATRYACELKQQLVYRFAHDEQRIAESARNLALPATPGSPRPSSIGSRLTAGSIPIQPRSDSLLPQSPRPRSSEGFPAFSERGQPLRPVTIPRDILTLFEMVSNANTAKGIETCGILFGYSSPTSFLVTDLLIPKQTGTTDTCSMENEEEIAEYQIENDLTMIGWIHTHPTQSCFMSSVDLHTHSCYQNLLPESIAIVVSPRSEPRYGVFRLTDPPGLGIVTRCTERGFHVHEDLGDKSAYRDADGPTGHVRWTDAQRKTKLIDLRAL